jgi:chromosome partitioning protein
MKNVLVKRIEVSEKTKTIAFVHHKGGTGKTTACLNVAGWLSKMKKKVLVIDLDPQGNATSGLGVDRATCLDSIYDAMFGQKNLQEVIIETDSGVYLAPSSLDLLAAETHLASPGRINNTVILKEKLSHLEDYFDYILIDVPPASTLLMINGIVASENIIIPLDSGVFAYETIETLKTLLIDLHKELGVEINIAMVVLKEFSFTVFDMIPTFEVRNLVKKFLLKNNMSQVKIFRVPFSRKIYMAQKRGLPISHYASFSDVGRAYKKIAKEILTSSQNGRG